MDAIVAATENDVSRNRWIGLNSVGNDDWLLLLLLQLLQVRILCETRNWVVKEVSAGGGIKGGAIISSESG
jgi:hypothetical protein